MECVTSIIKEGNKDKNVTVSVPHIQEQLDALAKAVAQLVHLVAKIGQ